MSINSLSFTPFLIPLPGPDVDSDQLFGGGFRKLQHHPYNEDADSATATISTGGTGCSEFTRVSLNDTVSLVNTTKNDNIIMLSYRTTLYTEIWRTPAPVS